MGSSSGATTGATGLEPSVAALGTTWACLVSFIGTHQTYYDFVSSQQTQQHVVGTICAYFFILPRLLRASSSPVPQ
jgi:hypothetical protein